MTETRAECSVSSAESSGQAGRGNAFRQAGFARSARMMGTECSVCQCSIAHQQTPKPRRRTYAAPIATEAGQPIRVGSSKSKRPDTVKRRKTTTTRCSRCSHRNTSSDHGERHFRTTDTRWSSRRSEVAWSDRARSSRAGRCTNILERTAGRWWRRRVPIARWGEAGGDVGDPHAGE